MGGREREREIERDREIRYWFELDTGWGTDAVCIDDAWNRAQTWLGTCPRYEWWMIADVCIGKQSGNPVMEAEATVSGGMEKVKQGGRGGFFASWTSFEPCGCWRDVEGKIIIFLSNWDRIGFFSIGLLSSID